MTLRRTLSGLALSAAAAAVVHPDRLRLDHRVPFVDAVAWRPHAAGALGAVAALLAIPKGSRPAAMALGGVALAALPSIAGRVWPRALPEPAADDLTVLSLNVLTGRADTGAVATLLEQERPDLVSLPEAGPDYREKLLPLVAAMGYRAWASGPSGVSDLRAVTLLASSRMGDVEVTTGPEMRHRYVRARGGLLGPRSFYAVHPEAPVSRRHAQRWVADLRQLSEWCRDPHPPIVAGDFNATLDHGPFRAAMAPLHSAAMRTGRALIGTFPAVAGPFGIQIDHVLVPPGTVTTRFDIVDVDGTDHRGVLTRLRLPAPA